MYIIGLIFNSLLLTVYTFLLALMALAAYSDHISPQTSVYPSFLGITFPIYLLAVVVVWLLLIVRRRWVAVGLGVIVMLCCGEPIIRYFPLRFASKAPAEAKTLKLLTYNTCGFGQNDSKQNGQKILDFIKEQNPDVVCLQEYAVKYRTDGLTERKIRAELTRLPYYYYCPSNSDSGSGLAVFSRYPISKRRSINYESLYNNSCMCELDVDGQPVTLFNNHLESNQLSKEDKEFYNQMIRHFDSDRIEDIRTTLVRKLARAYRVRAVQVDTLRSIIDRQTNPVIVCGDFNDTPVSYAYRHVRGNDLGDAYRDAGFGLGITYHENKFLFRIDHVLYSPVLKPYEATVHHVDYSDHYPVTVIFKLPDAPSEAP
jgi:endonuclease/exonuclease/phosphatase family metal-dependent hydrolase